MKAKVALAGLCVVLAGGCATTAEQRAAFGESVALELDDAHAARPFEIALAANERLLAIDPAEVLADALARCPQRSPGAIQLRLDRGLVRPGALGNGRFAALAPGAPPGGEAPELPPGVQVAGRLRLQAVVEHGEGGPRVLAQAIADFALVGDAWRWAPFLRAVSDAATERALAETLEAARGCGARDARRAP